MSNEPRKASEVLLELEAKIDNLINLVKAQNFANQLLSNKVNDLMGQLKQQTVPQKITVEAVNMSPQISTSPLANFKPGDPDRQVPISAEARLPQTNKPDGFRRTSRPETFSGDDVYLGQQDQNSAPPKFPVQMPKGPPPGRSEAEVVVPHQAQQPVSQSQSQPSVQPAKQPIVQNAIPVVQRVVNKDGKSIFLADVEITDMATSQSVFKTRTNGTGKWMASLSVGAYRVVIRKKGTSTSDRMEAIQDVQVDGSKSPLELQMIIIK